MKTGLCASLAAILLLSAGIAYASPSYYCCRTDKPIVIDGKMDEQSWKAVPSLLVFGDLAMGTAPAYRTVAKMLWDDQNLYVGFEMEDTNVWSVVDDLQGPGAKRAIMNHDLFVKVFLDPDADGQNYIELHVNPLNSL